MTEKKTLAGGNIRIWQDQDETIIHHTNELTIALTPEEATELLAWLQQQVQPKVHYGLVADGGSYGASIPTTLIEGIKTYVPEGDTCILSVHNDKYEEIGTAQCRYIAGKVFLYEIEADGAGIGLAKTLNEIVAKTAKHEETDTAHVEINKNTVGKQGAIDLGDGMAFTFTLALADEDDWTFRVKLFQDQAILGFPKHNTIGIGFAQESEEGWNTNLPYTCETMEIYEHIKHNKKYDEITDEQCIEAIKAIQECAKAAKTAKA